MKTSTERWAKVSGHPDYEVSTLGRVRSSKPRASDPRAISQRATRRLLKGSNWCGTRYYTIDGRQFDLGTLMVQAFGDAASQQVMGDRERRLSSYELQEIRDAEGFKTRYQVAEDFRIDSDRVREIWDGGE